MRKGFTRKPQGDEPAARVKNYITPSGLQRLKDEHRFLLTRERPAVTKVVAWAASNGDRSENADYQYGKRRLRQIDGRIRFLTKRIDAAEVVDPESPRAGQAATRAFFGATVRYSNAFNKTNSLGRNKYCLGDRGQDASHHNHDATFTVTMPHITTMIRFLRSRCRTSRS